MGCVPWDYPRQGAFPLCTKEHISYFRNNLTSPMITDEEDECAMKCLPDCQTLTFDYTFNSLELDPGMECSKKRVFDAAIKNVNEMGDAYFYRLMLANEG